MIGLKLFPLLAAMSPTEFRRMRKVFQSPFFTTNERHLVLYDLLKKHHPDFDSLTLSKEQIFKKLYPNKTFNDGLLRVLVREFTQMTEEYLLILKMRAEKFEQKKMLTQIYNDRNLYGFFEKETQKLLKDLNKNPYRDENYYREIYSLNFDYFFHPSTPKLPDCDAPLIEMMDSLDKQYALAKFRIGSEMMNRAKIFAKQYDVRFLKEIKNISKQDFAEDNVTFQLYLLLFQFYEASEEEKVSVFEKFKLVFLQNFKKLSRLDQSLFLTQLINFASKKINLGESAYYKKAFDLYKTALEADLVLRHGSIDEAVYGNIVLLGCQAGEFSWITEFMEKYKSHLLEEIREDTYEMNKGIVYFHKKDYENAQNQFINVAYSPKFQLKVRANLILTLYERFFRDCSFFGLLISQMNAFEKYLHRNFVKNEYQKEVYLNFIAIVKKMTNGVFENKDRKKLKLIIENQLVEKSKVIGKYWIEEKIKEWK